MVVEVDGGGGHEGEGQQEANDPLAGAMMVEVGPAVARGRGPPPTRAGGRVPLLDRPRGEPSGANVPKHGGGRADGGYVVDGAPASGPAAARAARATRAAARLTAASSTNVTA